MKKEGLISNINKNYMIFVFLVILLSTLSSGQFNKQNEILDFKKTCTLDGGICNSSASCNVSISYSNGTYLIQNQIMTNRLNGDFNYTLTESQTSISGKYDWDMYCCQGSNCNEAHDNYNINLLGTELTTQKSLIYILLTIGVLLIFGLSLYFTIIIPYSNEINGKGAIIKVTRKKYLKILMIGVTYSFFVWFLNLLIGVSNNFADLTLYYGLVSFLFTLFLNLTLPVFIFLLILAFFEIVRDSNIMKEIKKFGSCNR